MPTAELLSKGLDRDIDATHDRFVRAMRQRLPDMRLETKERYFAVLSSVVAKLEMPEKHWRDIVDEMVSESGAVLLAEFGGRR